MNTQLVLLAFLMFLVTYPSRALGLLAPAMDRLPRRALDYLQLVGPAVLALATGLTGSQRIGMATILPFLAAGLVLLGRPAKSGK